MNEHKDTTLTDYALGELPDAERLQLEARLKTDAAAREEADEVRRLGGMLRTSVSGPVANNQDSESSVSKSTELREELLRRLAPPAVVIAPAWRRRTRAAVAVAAGIALAASILLILDGTFGSRPKTELANWREPPTVYRGDHPRAYQLHDSDVDPGPEVALRQKLEAKISPRSSGANRNFSVADRPTALRVDVGAVNVFTRSGSTFAAAAPEPAGVVGMAAGPVIHSPTQEAVGYGLLPHAANPATRLKKELEPRPAQTDDSFDSIRWAEEESNTEQYQSEPENPFVRATDEPLSTFSIDVDTASYSNVRRFLASQQLPPPSAVRLEEFLNYFTYDYPTPTDSTPFSVTTEAARCPWNSDHTLVRIGLKGREVHRKERPASNLVFLVDVSGSMQDQNKLPLVRESLKMMVDELGDSDRVAIVVYAGSEGVALPPTGGDRKRTILETLDRLESGGSTNGAAGIQLAYQIAADNFIPKGINRVILATDGDFNVGVTSQGELVRLIEEKAKSGVFFSALGYGMGNLKDSTLEQLADKGNGNYAYIDTIGEARKVLVEQMSGTLMTIAKDVKIQIEFNPTTVAGYRLLGYENRLLAAQDFNDDKKDAGEIGAGHTVTALYELIPAGKAAKKEVKKLPEVDPLKYQSAPVAPPQSAELAKELLTLKLRYKEPDGDKSKLIETPVKNDVVDYGKASNDFKFASAVAGFGMLLRHSKYHGSATFDAVIELAEAGIGRDVGGYRKEFVELVRKARDLRKK